MIPADELVEVMKAGAGENAFEADAAKFLREVQKKLGFLPVPRREIAVPALGIEHQKFSSLRRNQEGFPQTGSRRQDGEAPLRFRNPVLQHLDFGRLQKRDGTGHGGEIVDQPHRIQVQPAPQMVRLHHPGQIGHLTAAVLDGAGDAEPGLVHRLPRLPQKLVENVFQPLVRPAFELGLFHPVQPALPVLEQGQVDFGASNIACENHPGPQPAAIFAGFISCVPGFCYPGPPDPGRKIGGPNGSSDHRGRWRRASRRDAESYRDSGSFSDRPR